jgi:hypothetical protein
VASHSLGKVEAYLTVREILPETSKGADGVAWCGFSGFGPQQVCNVRVEVSSASYLRERRRMPRLLVGDECDGIAIKITTVHWETGHCHSERSEES